MSRASSVPNIGPRQRAMRFNLGVAMAVAAAGYLGLALALDWPRILRLGVFLPVWLSALGFTQHREKT